MPALRRSKLHLGGAIVPREGRMQVRTRSSADASASGGDAGTPKNASGVIKALGAAVLVATVATGAFAALNPAVATEVMKKVAQTGFTAAFTLIFVSELGDKTFFIAALLAMKKGKALVLAGATSALAVMTVISVAIGRLFKQVPAAFETTVPIGEYLAIALLVFFGGRTLWDTYQASQEKDEEGGSGEYADAVREVQGADLKGEGWVASFIETFGLIFVAEWGDRSMLATIALGAAQNPVGVCVGAIVGHFVATLIAVVGGSLISGYVSEEAVGYTGGALFIVFAIATALGVY